MNGSRRVNQWQKLWEEFVYSCPDYGHAARPYCESNCELAQVYTYLAYRGLLGKDGVWAFSLPVPGQETNDTAEAARVAGALREDRGLCCSCATVRAPPPPPLPSFNCCRSRKYRIASVERGGGRGGGVLFSDWLSSIHFAQCQASEDRRVTGLWDPNHTLWHRISHSDTAGTL